MENKRNIIIIAKIGAASNNHVELKEIDSPRYYTGKMKKEVDKFFEYYRYHTQFTTDLLFKADLKTACALYIDMSDNIDINVEDPDEEFRQVGCMLGKLTSALKDLKEVSKMSMESRLFAGPLISRLSSLLTRPYFRNMGFSKQGLNRIVELTDSDYLGVI